jgi:GT2 family glycosyltransferase
MSTSIDPQPINQHSTFVVGTSNAATLTSHVAIVVVAYNNSLDVQRCLTSVFESEDPHVHKSVVLVDNSSNNFTEQLIREQFPSVHYVKPDQNLGFTGGNNLGFDYVKEQLPEVEYLYLLNQDTRVDSGWLEQAVVFANAHKNVGCIQSKILLLNDESKLNTAGNRCHYLGFGFVQGCDEVDQGQYDEVRSIDFASGAAAMVRMSAIHNGQLFDEHFFMYMEDVGLCWRLKLWNYDVVFLPTSRVFHRYEPAVDFKHYYFLERNRLWLLLSYYKLATLLLLSPMLLLMEAGQLFFAAKLGRLHDKLRAYAYYMKPSVLRKLWHSRRAIQNSRVKSDRELLTKFSGSIDLPTLDGFLVKRVANPIFSAYWYFAKRMITW